MKKLVRAAAAASVVTALLVGGASDPATAATKKKRVTTTKRSKVPSTTSTVPTTIAATTVAPSPDPNAAVPPSTVAAVTPPSSALPATPPTTAITEASMRDSFTRMFLPRDIWRFDASVELSAQAEALRRELNAALRVDVYIGADARVMVTTADNRAVAVVLALVADPKFIRPEVLQSSVRQTANSLSQTKVLKVDGGVAIAGVNRGLGVAAVAFDNFYIEVIGPDRQRAIDAAFLTTTNMGRQLTE